MQKNISTLDILSDPAFDTISKPGSDFYRDESMTLLAGPDTLAM